mmetsp:Transcript_6674/g.16203  ORF Transcript_6674/g.16203 Transcript_6674/m.16203 type:complete len:274 (+) Transcript_6674:184-1005(+)
MQLVDCCWLFRSEPMCLRPILQSLEGIQESSSQLLTSSQSLILPGTLSTRCSHTPQCGSPSPSRPPRPARPTCSLPSSPPSPHSHSTTPSSPGSDLAAFTAAPPLLEPRPHQAPPPRAEILARMVQRGGAGGRAEGRAPRAPCLGRACLRSAHAFGTQAHTLRSFPSTTCFAQPSSSSSPPLAPAPPPPPSPPSSAPSSVACASQTSTRPSSSSSPPSSSCSSGGPCPPPGAFSSSLFSFSSDFCPTRSSPWLLSFTPNPPGADPTAQPLGGW